MDIVLNDKYLEKLINNNAIVSSNGTDLTSQIQPASIDIPLGEYGYLVKQKFIPFQKDVESIAKDLSLEKIDLTKGANLYKGNTYLIPCLDVDLPENYEIRISPKSSIGRIDLFVRSVFDNHHYYDRIPQGRKGKLWIEVTPQSFNVKVHYGLSLNQLKVFEKKIYSSETLTDEALLFDDSGKEILNNWESKNKLLLSLKTSPNSIFGYEALPTNELLDLSKIGEHDPTKYFRELEIGDKGKFTLEKDKFYILRTSENIMIPKEYSAEMIPFFHLVGELRAHYAGFFDPAFGQGSDGSLQGSAGVLEIRPHETLTVYDKQPICLLEYYANKEVPTVVYGDKGNNYLGQNKPKLAKYFSDWPIKTNNNTSN